ncbi:phage/plasmid primase, P4 family [uncultured Methylobacterium sp.]|uniref:phage/plasmid primase, P4 family n=1 Tax=uncultured Methylobacterium sp. TaxID=157278 RepID=UPI00262EA35B|nr:phage/plasmid primase, P4 family [uncultured Methylobacterium sp.]
MDLASNYVGSSRDAAFGYAACGLRVIPIPLRSKGPTMRSWQHKASTDPDTIADFFPKGFCQNIGIVLGNGIVSLDVDPQHGGLDTLKALEAAHGPLPRAPTQQTGGGGLHYLFQVSGGVKLKNRTGFRPGLDLKSDNGQIVAAPSVHPNGNTYKWLPGLAPGEVEIPEMPGWLLDILLKPEAKPLDGGRNGGVKEGGRNVALTREAGRLRARGADENEVRTALIARNSTFLPPLDLSEVNTVVASAMKWEPGRLRYTANDHGLATRFVDELGDDLHFVADENQWLIWNGNIWERDEKGRVVQLFLEMALAILTEAEAIPAAEDDKNAFKAKEKAIGWAKQAGESKRVNSALKLAQTDPRVVVTLAELDNFPGFLPVANGMVELATGELLANPKEKLATRASPYAYTAGAACPRWEAVIARALPSELSPFFQRVLGYSLMGNPCEQRFFMLWGKGADSKSTVARVMSGLLGSLLIRPAGETFLASDNEITGSAPRADLMCFLHARVAFAPEPDSRRKLDKELIKRLTGEDGLSARPPYGRKVIEFETPTVVFMLANHLPGCEETDDAAWRRLTLIPFDHTVPEGERDVTLVQTLLTNEAEGILAWLIEGAQSYARDGLQVPEVVRQRTAAWRRQVGRIERFVDENCIREGSARVADLQLKYRAVCMAEQIHPLGLDKFSSRLKQLGFTIEFAQAGETVTGLRSRY